MQLRACNQCGRQLNPQDAVCLACQPAPPNQAPAPQAPAPPAAPLPARLQPVTLKQKLWSPKKFFDADGWRSNPNSKRPLIWRVVKIIASVIGLLGVLSIIVFAIVIALRS